jgi:hypothetical protein
LFSGKGSFVEFVFVVFGIVVSCVTNLFESWCKQGEKKDCFYFLLTGAATFYYSIWLARNKTKLFLNRKPKNFVQVLLQETYWLRH